MVYLFEGGLILCLLGIFATALLWSTTGARASLPQRKVVRWVGDAFAWLESLGKWSQCFSEQKDLVCGVFIA